MDIVDVMKSKLDHRQKLFAIIEAVREPYEQLIDILRIDLEHIRDGAISQQEILDITKRSLENIQYFYTEDQS